MEGNGKLNTNPTVDAYMQQLENPCKNLWEHIRTIILGVDPKIEEAIKWSAPTFTYKGNMATFNPRSKHVVSLLFHTGALIEDPEGVLEGEAKKARVFRVATMEELQQKTFGLQKVVRNWIQLKDQ